MCHSSFEYILIIYDIARHEQFSDVTLMTIGNRIIAVICNIFYMHS